MKSWTEKVYTFTMSNPFLLVFVLAATLGLFNPIAYLGENYAFLSNLSIQHYAPRVIILLGMVGLLLLDYKKRVLTKLQGKKGIWIAGLLLTLLILINQWGGIVYYSKLLAYFPPFTVEMVVFFMGILSLKQLLTRYTFFEIGGLFLVFVVLTNIIVSLTNLSPFSSSFSEGSWIYSADQVVIFLKTGKNISWPILDPIRIFILAFPILLNLRSILLLRVYTAVIEISLDILTAYVIIKRLKIQEWRKRLFLLLWGFLLFHFVSIPSDVLIGACILIAGIDFTNLGKTVCILLISSVLEGLCRINWFAFPAITTVILYVFDHPLRDGRLWKYLRKPFLLALFGVIIAFTTYFIYTRFTNTPFIYFNKDFQYIYIYPRIFPNNVLLPGCLLGSMIVGVPPNIFSLYSLSRTRTHWFRVFLIGMILIAAFFVGTIISSRIGGGNNFHNYDLYFMLTYITLVYSSEHKIRPDREAPEGIHDRITAASPVFDVSWLGFLLVFLLTVPTASITKNNAQTRNDLIKLQNFLNGYQNQPVFFLSEQQLSALGAINVDHPVYDYDYVTLTEYLMARNDTLPNQFLKAIKNGSYPLMVSFQINTDRKQAQNNYFIEENNILLPYNFEIIKYYKPIFELKDVGVDVYYFIK